MTGNRKTKKNLLVLTQKVDINDPVLGFFHGWLIEFAKQFEKITVICLKKGEHSLPDNIKVLSLGKEDGVSRRKYLGRFYKYIFSESGNYRSVLVHMNAEYVVLGGLFWRLMGKKVFLWCNHKMGGAKVSLAVFLATKVFHTSEHAFVSRFKKAMIMPAGIDTEMFVGNEQIEKIPNSILSLGRISPVKSIEVLIEALKSLDKRGVDFIANIYGDAPERDRVYGDKIKEEASLLVQKGKVNFYTGPLSSKIPDIYSQHKVFVNLTGEGSFDKTVLEAMACRTIPLVANSAFVSVLPERFLFKEGDAVDLADKLEKVFSFFQDEIDELGGKFRGRIKGEHSLTFLTEELGWVLFN